MNDKDQIQDNTRRYMEMLLDAGCPLKYVAQEGHKITMMQYEDAEKAARMWEAAQILAKCTRSLGIDLTCQIASRTATQRKQK